ncbi:MAG: ZIP family metal transporter [Candidatus Dormibacteraceae bacterium]
MTQSSAAAFGAIAGLTIFIGLPIARVRGLSKAVQGFLNAVATGILVFLLWDILSHASNPVERALSGIHHGQPAPFLGLAATFGGGIAVGLLVLVYFNTRLAARFKRQAASPSSRPLVLMIASGLGLHNLSEGLAIGQSAATGAVAFAGVLVIGFALHNITEGFGIAAPMALDAKRPSWRFLAGAGLIGGAPTFVGTVLGSLVTSPYVYVLFLALAAGALIYVLNELFNLGKRLNTPGAMGWGLLVGFMAAYSTDLFLTYLSV